MKLLTGLLFLLPAVMMGQVGSFTIEGHISGQFQPSRAYLIYNSGTVTTIDSAIINAGNFSFKGAVDEPGHANVVLDHKGQGLNAIDPKTADMLNIYVEKGKISIAITDSVSKASVSGSAINDDYQQFKMLLKPLIQRFNVMMAEYYALPADKKGLPEVQANFTEKYRLIDEEQKQILAGYIAKNPGKLVSLDALKAFGGPEPNVTLVEPLYNLLTAEIRSSADGKAYGAVINRFKVTAIGSIAPDFVQNDPDGRPVQLSSFRGKYLLIDFWASWCGPCRQENPNIVRMYNQYKDKNFTILGVSLDRPGARQSWLKAIENDKLSWSQVSDLKYWQNDAAVLYGVKSIPQNYLLDPEGRIIAKDLRGEELRIKLAELLK